MKFPEKGLNASHFVSSMKRKYLALFLLTSVLLGCSELVLEKNISDKTVVLLSPSDSSVLNTLTPNFWWEEVEGAASYKIQIVSPSFDNPTRLFVDTVVNKTQFSVDLDTVAFEWRVKALNGGYQTEFSKAGFTILSGSEPENRSLKLISPADSSYIKTREVELKWEEAKGVEKYNLVVEGDTSIDINLSKEETSKRIKFGENKSYSWKIIPINAPNFLQSSVFKFTIDTKAPTVPSLEQPLDNANIIQQSVSFRWTSSDEHLAKNILIISDESGTAVITRETSSGTNIDISKTELGESGQKRSWVIKSIDKAGNEAVSVKRNFIIQ